MGAHIAHVMSMLPLYLLQSQPFPSGDKGWALQAIVGMQLT